MKHLKRQKKKDTSKYEEYKKEHTNGRNNSLLEVMLSGVEHNKQKKHLADLVIRYKMKLERSKVLQDYCHSKALANQYTGDKSMFSFYKTGNMFNNGSSRLALTKEVKLQKQIEDLRRFTSELEEQFKQDKLQKLHR